MRATLLVLLLANLLLFAYMQGVFGTLSTSGREPGRVALQIAPDSIRVVSDAEVRQLREREKTGNGAERSSLVGPAACVEFGDFDADAAAAAQARLATLNLGERLATRAIDAPGWYIVYLPPLKTRAEAERAADELRSRGVRNLLVIGDDSPLRNGVLLGSFKDQELARRHQGDLKRRGIEGVRVGERPSMATVTRFRISGLDVAAAERLAAIQAEFPQARVMPCQQ